MPQIITLGSIVFDRVYEVAAIPREPVKVLARGYRETGGGMAATAALAIASLGGEASFWGRVGADADGALLRHWMIEAGIDVRGLWVVEGGRTPTSVVIVDPAGERLLAAFIGAGLGQDAGWLPLADVASADAALCDVRWPEGSLALLRKARRSGIPSVLDAEIAEASVMAQLTAEADHVVFSSAALSSFTGTADPIQALRALPAHDWVSVGVTLGERGYVGLAHGEVQEVPGFVVPAADTNGAGDTFHGAFALAIARGARVAEAARFANAAAAIKCRNGKGWRGMPTADDVGTLMVRNATRKEVPGADIGG